MAGKLAQPCGYSIGGTQAIQHAESTVYLHSPLSHARPTLDYAGSSFKGCFPWVPPRGARLRGQTVGTGETLAVELESANAAVDLALPPLPISGKQTYQVQLSLTGHPVQFEWT